ncbi:hypothetical protein CIG75_12955 [Tumebacillus algifaecis]|uniref:Uncharacterized protein n=1 Tax=Tumebacillus algifaecis TaxID=1214604 RepID=A0A223D2C6_9BACL|nr:hypothetical protein [Tumebacillus algifaecis]ASS75808.1 hypothetical protein CIG75_12955 [Tumebacillus algifaecis]
MKQPVNIPFECQLQWPESGEQESWNGTIDQIINRGSHIEFHIKSRSGFWCVAAPYQAGNLLVIEADQASLGLAHPNDLFYNKEKVLQCEHLNTVDGITAVYALKALADAGHYEGR